MELASVQTIRHLSQKYGFSFSRDLGQNFLVDSRIPEAIAEGAGVEGKCVLEIGPGIGSLTVCLAARAKKLCALELDRSLLPILDETLSPFQNASVVWGDVLKTDLSALVSEKFGSGEKLCAVSNLPYCVTTPAILRLVGSGLFESVTVMIQKEAAKKLLCDPGGEDWCLFSALVRSRAGVKKLFSVSKGCFYPQPKVDSTVLRLELLPEKSREETEVFEKTAKAIFGQRRKNVKNTLSLLPGLTPEKAELLLISAGIDPKRRGESLSVEEISSISTLMVQRIQKDR